MEDLQSLLEKINRDGVEKADAEAKRIVDAAKARADAIVKEAREAEARGPAPDGEGYDFEALCDDDGRGTRPACQAAEESNADSIAFLDAVNAV